MTFNQRLSRVRRAKINGLTACRWEPMKMPLTEGVIVGRRTLSQGEYEPMEWLGLYHPSEYFDVYLIAYDIRKNPVYVPIENAIPVRFADFLHQAGVRADENRLEGV